MEVTGEMSTEAKHHLMPLSTEKTVPNPPPPKKKDKRNEYTQCTNKVRMGKANEIFSYYNTCEQDRTSGPQTPRKCKASEH